MTPSQLAGQHADLRSTAEENDEEPGRGDQAMMVATAHGKHHPLKRTRRPHNINTLHTYTHTYAYIHYITLHYIALHYTSTHSTVQCSTVQYSTYHTLHYITLIHAVHYSTLEYSTLHTYIHTHIHTYIHTYKQTNKHTYTHTYIHTYTHSYTHTHIHTYIHGSSCERFKVAPFHKAHLVRTAPVTTVAW